MKPEEFSDTLSSKLTKLSLTSLCIWASHLHFFRKFFWDSSKNFFSNYLLDSRFSSARYSCRISYWNFGFDYSQEQRFHHEFMHWTFLNIPFQTIYWEIFQVFFSQNRPNLSLGTLSQDSPRISYLARQFIQRFYAYAKEFLLNYSKICPESSPKIPHRILSAFSRNCSREYLRNSFKFFQEFL